MNNDMPKEERLRALHSEEDEMNRWVGWADKEVLRLKHEIDRILQKKVKMAKSIAYNMKLRNKIINEKF